MQKQERRENLRCHTQLSFYNLTFDEYNTILYVVCLTPYSILLQMTEKLFMYGTLGQNVIIGPRKITTFLCASCGNYNHSSGNIKPTLRPQYINNYLIALLQLFRHIYDNCMIKQAACYLYVICVRNQRKVVLVAVFLSASLHSSVK